jgi:hypothetical protein
MRDGSALCLTWFMQTTRRQQLLYAMLGFTFGQLLIGAKPLAAQEDCKLVLDAMTKLFDTPAHVYITMNMSGKPQTAESIYVGGSIYTKYDGKWSTGMTTREMKEMSEKNRQNNKMTCRYLKDEPVNGEIAAAYSMHDVSPKTTSDSKVWISKAKGLPVRSDSDMEGTHISTRYEYGNVKPPI